MDVVEFNGWGRNVRLSNEEIELIVTQDVGPRVLRCAFKGGPNLFAELAGQQGGVGEPEWMIRGGHRFWVAPEEKPKTYELDNAPVSVEDIPGGIRTLQPAGPLSGVSKSMDITLSRSGNHVKVVHTLRNETPKPVVLAPWALSVMAPKGQAIIPLPRKIAHTDRLTHNQEWSLWGYTDLSDPRWTLGSRYLLFRQDPSRGPNKLGLAHREGWVAYQLQSYLFIKRFSRLEGAAYPDGGVNFETFSNEDFLEVETLGALVTLAPGATAAHEEQWFLFRNIPPCASEADVDKHIIPAVSATAARR